MGLFISLKDQTMNKHEWDSIPMPDKDEMVAELVLGWSRPTKECEPWRDGDGGSRYCMPYWTTSRNACYAVLEKIGMMGIMDDLVYGDVLDEWIAPWLTDDGIDVGAALLADPDTICYCAVKAVENENT